MRWDLGLQGLGLLIVMSLGFGVIAQLVMRRATTRWLWLIAAAGYFVGGLFISEVWFGWATQEELQPNIDGLSFDEVLLIGLVPGIVTVLVTWYVRRRTRRHSTDVASNRSSTHRSRPTSGAV
jgi:MFS family permease